MAEYRKLFRGNQGIGVSGMGTPFYVDERGNEVDEATALTNLVHVEDLYEHQQRQHKEMLARPRVRRRTKQ